MKKFSKITKFKVAEEPKKEVKINEEDLFKTKVMTLMEQFLSVRTYGPVDRYARAGTIKISGQEMFLEALMNLLKDKSSKDEIKILESLKSTVSNWKAIDNKITEIQNNIISEEQSNKMILHKNKLKSLYENYSQDEELLLKMVTKSCEKIKNKETAYLRGLAAEYMANEGNYSKELFLKISEKYKDRSNNL